MGSRRLYPEKPIVGVGVLIRDGEKYLLIKRAAEPDEGLWSVPGGLVEVGEKAVEAAVREAREETGLNVEILEILGVVDKIVNDEEGKIKYHFVIIDYLAAPTGGSLVPASDALDALWVLPEELTGYELSPTLVELLKRVSIYPEQKE
jgi:8-oxo-dGTP diphosphatase